MLVVLENGIIGALAVREEHRRLVRLEAGDRLRAAREADDVDGGADAHRDRQWLELLVEGDEHARPHRADEDVEQEVVLAEHDALEVEADVEQRQQPRHRRRVGQRAVRIIGNPGAAVGTEDLVVAARTAAACRVEGRLGFSLVSLLFGFSLVSVAFTWILLGFIGLS